MTRDRDASSAAGDPSEGEDGTRPTRAESRRRFLSAAADGGFDSGESAESAAD